MGRIDGTSRDNGRPAGVADAFHVSVHSVEPILANRCRNLLSHDDIGPAGTDECEEDGPEVPFVFLALAAPRDREGLAGAGAGPKRAAIFPASESGSEAPSADPGEEVTLGVASQVVRADIENAPLIHIARRNQVPGHQIAQPLRSVGVEFVVISGHVTLFGRLEFW
jgi:hypothetical protein